MVGAGGFLIGQEGAMGPTLLSLAEFDLHAATKYDPYRWDSPQARCLRRYKAGAGFAPVLDSLAPEHAALAAMHADTPIILWPARDKNHLPWWRLCRQLPAGGFRVESDLLANERRFTTSSGDVHGTLFDGGDGKMILLLAAEKAGAAKVTLDKALGGVKAVTVQTLDGQAVPLGAGGAEFQAGTLAAWDVKGFRVSVGKEAGK
jgi:hypothetical protein